MKTLSQTKITGIIFLMLMSILPAGTTNGQLKGTVTDASTGDPVVGANVYLENSRIGAATYADGKYLLLNIPPGMYTVICKMIGYQSVSFENVEIIGGQTAEIHFKLLVSTMQSEMISVAPPPANDSFFHRVGAMLDFGNKKELTSATLAAEAGGYRDHSVIQDFNTEEYDFISENTFLDALQNPLSTFSIDVDNASYANVRRYLNQYHSMPPADAVRIEEMINYFTYDYPQPSGKRPFSITTEVGECPWAPEHQLVHIGLQGRNPDYNNLKPSNLVFLLDVSGSMDSPEKLPLVKKAFKMLVKELDGNDRVAVVVYAGAAGLVLQSTPAHRKDVILAALDRLNAGGSTAGGAGIRLAYQTALENHIPGGNNRVILATDGDFNIGTSSTSELVRLIEEKRQQDVYLTITGFGMGNYKDGRMEQISNAGNGNYFYIDNVREAEKVFVRELRANMVTIAKDVKIQVEFNPAVVGAYRLIGYENRMLEAQDFNDDKKDAGELGAGHTVTALYEIIPVGLHSDIPTHDPLKYQSAELSGKSRLQELMTVKLRYKPIGEETSLLIETALADEHTRLKHTSDNFRFSAAVAGFGMLLRESEFSGDLTYDNVWRLAHRAMGSDTSGDRHEFVRMVESCKLMN